MSADITRGTSNVLCMALSDFAELIPNDHEFGNRSGKVFYSGESAFTGGSGYYLLGFNPGGDPVKQSEETIWSHTQKVLDLPTRRWSAFLDEKWKGQREGTAKTQKRVAHLFDRLGVDLRETPSSNLVFVRSEREKDLGAETNQLIEQCWGFHSKVISELRIHTVICLGRTTGAHVREMLSANESVRPPFVERNERRWKSSLHVSAAGVRVATLTHPAIADWRVPATDPSGLLIA